MLSPWIVLPAQAERSQCVCSGRQRACSSCVTLPPSPFFPEKTWKVSEGRVGTDHRVPLGEDNLSCLGAMRTLCPGWSFSTMSALH